jgi:peptide/nickel transport system permease protein
MKTLRAASAHKGSVRAARAPVAAVLAALVLLASVAAASLAPWLAPLSPVRQVLDMRLAPPGSRGVEATYILGADHLGRDLLSRVIYGARISMTVGLAAVAIGTIAGTTLGVAAGYGSPRIDEIVMSVVDIQLAFPSILLAIAIIAVLGSGFLNLILVIGFTGWATYARIMRGEVLRLKAREFIEGARALGASEFRIVRRHLLPNGLSPLVVVATLDFARSIILESTLSFLGLGIQPPTPSWGSMLSEGREYLQTAWWIATFPGLALMLVSLSLNLLGDYLRDRLDPTLRV